MIISISVVDICICKLGRRLAPIVTFWIIDIVRFILGLVLFLDYFFDGALDQVDGRLRQTPTF